MLACLSVFLLLAACGGGGGGSEGGSETTSSVPAVPPPAASAPVVVTPPPPAQAAAVQCELPDFQAELLRLINERRARGAVCGAETLAAAPALAWQTQLAQAAARHSQDMADKSFFSHTGSDGSNAGQRISATGYTWSRWGENIAYGYTSSAAVVDGWMKSEGHCRNIMNPAFTEMGLACVRQSQSNPASTVRWAWTQALATPR
ncbi:CAP domain-containing protein [Roseateles sp. DAIF2]|nr:CAP domain-containing protein [Roseateles sp. DAIF2]